MPSLPVPRWLVIVMISAALIGFADASYLTAQHIRGVLPPCTLEGCDLVLTSKYASVAGIPVPALGMLYYGMVIVLLVAYLDAHRWLFLHITTWLTGAGFLASLYFLFIQLFVIKAICPYCVLSAVTGTILFAVSVRIMRIN